MKYFRIAFCMVISSALCFGCCPEVAELKQKSQEEIHTFEKCMEKCDVIRQNNEAEYEQCRKAARDLYNQRINACRGRVDCALEAGQLFVEQLNNCDEEFNSVVLECERDCRNQFSNSINNFL